MYLYIRIQPISKNARVSKLIRQYTMFIKFIFHKHILKND